MIIFFTYFSFFLFFSERELNMSLIVITLGTDYVSIVPSVTRFNPVEYVYLTRLNHVNDPLFNALRSHT